MQLPPPLTLAERGALQQLLSLRLPSAGDAAAALAESRLLLLQLAAEYLVVSKSGSSTGGGSAAALDPVARFHCSNGAALRRINWGCALAVREPAQIHQA
jgi:hypothetical protein